MLKKKIADCTYSEDYLSYKLYDFNKDGIKELLVYYDDGSRSGGCDVYTYRNKKVVCLADNPGSDIYYIKGEKYFVAYASGGALSYYYQVYKIKNGKAVKVSNYESDMGKLTKDGKPISESKFNKFVSKLKDDLGKYYKVPRKYYTPNELGAGADKLTVNGITKVTKATTKKLYYYTYKLGDEQIIKWKSKTKSAKITKDTKFYYGDKELLWYGNLEGFGIDNKKWVYEISLKQFLKRLEEGTDTMNQVVVKNGKVVRVIINIQTVG
jgi:hypothetical protein